MTGDLLFDSILIIQIMIYQNVNNNDVESRNIQILCSFG